ncbi:hypothetical protein PN36_03525 [Candidatus Thiomargarita nelsonii]|uniref:Gingipain domain-containing protein n=1 Tax=Candidatus Thiomargarita nelsonii TaxID=1003181 RepID=A0A4E0QSS1_9GAMM|nr:hypothetical protein PN36_03525 [Candidatus Thiomargarita nelsonii]
MQIFLSTILLSLLLVPMSTLAEIRLIDENPQSLILELTFSGRLHSKEVPSTLIAVPSDSQIQLEIIEQETEIVKIEEPFHQLEQPTSPVEIGMTGYIREQRVAQIQFFPVRHNPAQKTVEIDKSLRVKVRFINNNARSGKVPLETVQDSPAFERMLDQLLLNDRTVKQVLRSVKTREDCPLPLPPALKLSIDKTGVYALSYSYFQEKLELDLSVLDARQIHLSHQGEAVPIFIAGEEDGVFGPGDVMFFYAQAGDGPYTRTNIYWLSLKDDGSARLRFGDGTPNPSHPPLTEFRQTVHVEENKIYLIRLPKEVEKDHIFWKQLSVQPTVEVSLDMAITLQHISSSTENATLRVMMQGRSDNHDYEFDDHHTKILLNEVEISEQLWDGKMESLQETNIPQSSLLEGDNLVRLVSVGDVGNSPPNQLHVNWLEIDYIATLTAISDQLTFETVEQGPHQLTVGGFSQSELLVLDVTHPRQVVPLLGARVQEDEAGTYQIHYSDNLDGNKVYYAFNFAKHLLKPAEISIDIPSSRLQSPCNQADYFIIYHDSFNVDALKNLVKGRGLGVMAVPVSKIYNEFNHGMPSPQAIKDFLRYAYENYTAPAPAYVALVGDANQDLLNQLGHGINYVPTNLFYTSQLGVTATDNDYVTVSGDDNLPDMFLGRIPVRTQIELDAIVKKLTRYSQVPLDGWQHNVLFVTGNDSRLKLEESADRLIEKHLANYTPKRVYLSEYSGDTATANATARQDIVQNINTGTLITTYFGHGSVANWGGQLFKSSDVDLLGNPLTFVMALNCINGLFSNYQQFDGHDDSLAEAFLKADGKGAIGVWAPTGQGYTFEHERLADEFFKLLLEENVTTLGPLTTEAKIRATYLKGELPPVNHVNLKIFTLFGEPSLQLRLE